MSELKWQWVYYPYLDAPTKQEESALKAGYIKVVVKEDVDKVIADLDESHKKEVEQLLLEIVKLKDNLKETREWLIESQKMHKRCADNAIKQILHQKYKRCLAMANWCGDACDKWMMRKAKAISLGKDGVEWYHRARRKLFHYMRWQKRWLKLAEYFKEDV